MWPEVFERLRTPVLDCINARLSSSAVSYFLTLHVASAWPPVAVWHVELKHNSTTQRRRGFNFLCVHWSLRHAFHVVSQHETPKFYITVATGIHRVPQLNITFQPLKYLHADTNSNMLTDSITTCSIRIHTELLQFYRNFYLLVICHRVRIK